MKKALETFFYFDYPGCYAYTLFAVKSLMWAGIRSVYLGFLVNRHSPPEAESRS